MRLYFKHLYTVVLFVLLDSIYDDVLFFKSSCLDRIKITGVVQKIDFDNSISAVYSGVKFSGDF